MRRRNTSPAGVSDGKRNFAELLWEAESASRDRVPMLEQGWTTSYGELVWGAAGVVRALVAAETAPGDRVSVLLPRGPESPALAAGATVVPVEDLCQFTTDPAVDDRIHGTMGLHLDLSTTTAVVCLDEKTQIYALDRTQPLRPALAARQTHDGQRHKVASVFTALDVARGRDPGVCRPRHAGDESFLDAGPAWPVTRHHVCQVSPWEDPWSTETAVSPFSAAGTWAGPWPVAGLAPGATGRAKCRSPVD